MKYWVSSIFVWVIWVYYDFWYETLTLKYSFWFMTWNVIWNSYNFWTIYCFQIKMSKITFYNLSMSTFSIWHLFLFLIWKEVNCYNYSLKKVLSKQLINTYTSIFFSEYLIENQWFSKPTPQLCRKKEITIKKSKSSKKTLKASEPKDTLKASEHFFVFFSLEFL